VAFVTFSSSEHAAAALEQADQEINGEACEIKPSGKALPRPDKRGGGMAYVKLACASVADKLVKGAYGNLKVRGAQESTTICYIKVSSMTPMYYRDIPRSPRGGEELRAGGGGGGGGGGGTAEEEWECQKCRRMVFARNSSCLLCKTRRPTSRDRERQRERQRERVAAAAAAGNAWREQERARHREREQRLRDRETLPRKTAEGARLLAAPAPPGGGRGAGMDGEGGQGERPL
jgi:hypothetical protein